MNSKFYLFGGPLCRFTTLIMLMICAGVAANAQVTVTPNQTALQLAQKLTGNGVIVTNATLSCPGNANGIFTVGPLPSNIGLDSGLILTSGQAATSGITIGVNGMQGSASTLNNAPGDAQLTTIAGQPTFDACSLEFDFVPAGDTVKFQYVFSSVEYFGFSCSIYNDVFGFFISGPGIVGQKNIAVIPGTTIPVTVNSTTNPAVTNPGSLTLCTAMGAGSPFSQYFVNNTGGTTVTHRGFTTLLQAISSVTPCQTYHLKLAIADGSDGSLDSGVWLKAGSLTSNAITVQPIGGGNLAAPLPYCIRNCLPGQFKFQRPVALTTPLTIHYLIQGSAVNGVDYTFIPDSITIPANQTAAIRNIYALAPPFGFDSVILKVLSPYTCSNGTPIIVDSAKIYILDSVATNILNNDTTVCLGSSVQLNAQVFGGPTVIHSWSPAAGLSCTSCINPIATPTVTTTYTLRDSIAGSGCRAGTDTVRITVRFPAAINAGPDHTTCVGTQYTIPTTVNPSTQNYTWSWTPATQLSSTTVKNPVYLATAVTPWTQYIVTADPGGATGCIGRDTVMLRTIDSNFVLLTPDTAICKGGVIHTRIIADTVHSYMWTPTSNVSAPQTQMPDITPDTSLTYTITSTYPGCPSKSHSFHVDVQPIPVVSVGPDLAKCQWDELYLFANVGPTWYTNYTYAWTPDSNLNSGNMTNVIFNGQHSAILVFSATTPAGCVGKDTINITVHQGNFASLIPTADTAICPRDSVQLQASGGVSYVWTPGTYLNDSTISNPVSHPTTIVGYTVLATDQFGCKDTLQIALDVSPEAVISLPDSVTIWAGESYQISPQSNCLYYTWFPQNYLSDPNVPNPLATPPVNTRYIVNASTEAGCHTTDSLYIIVNEETGIDVPNAFSPGSQPNSVVKVVHRGLATLGYFRIFNRWGTKVFETTDISQGWDGQYNGAPQPMGVYIYTVEAVTATGKHFQKQGNITLLR